MKKKKEESNLEEAMEHASVLLGWPKIQKIIYQKIKEITIIR